MTQQLETDRWMLPVDEAIRLSGFTRTYLFNAMAAGHVTARKAGRRTLVDPKSLRAHIDALPSGTHGKRREAARRGRAAN